MSRSRALSRSVAKPGAKPRAATVRPDGALECAARQRLGPQALICGVDEAGRGPLAGPVVAAACRILPRAFALVETLGLRDSKRLSADARERLFGELAKLRDQELVDTAVGAASVNEIGRLNILRANDLAMRRAVARLERRPELALVDGNRAPPALGCSALPVVKGDACCLSIAAASVLAKVTRDRIMQRLAARYAGYGWEKNAGYPTAAHRRAIAELGATAHHRRGFAGVG